MPTPDPDPSTGPGPLSDAGGTRTDGPGGGGTASYVPGPDTAFPFLAPPQAADEIGRLGKYRVLGVLGKGGMGAVFRAEEPALRRLVALKVMLPQFAGNELAAARFLREARAAAKVEHDYILPILTVDEDRGVPFIAMPLLKGMPLSDALRAARPPLAEALRVGREMAEGLAAAHEKGLVHRDIKPANVWLEGNRRRVKILDFGLARAAEGGGDSPDDPATESGAVIGTPAYMSVEQANGRPVDARTDLWSLGVVLYEMATGKRPFTGPNTMAILSALALHTPPPADTLAPDCPPDLARLIAALLEKDPARRPGSAAWVAEELARIEQSLSVGMTQPVPLAEAADDPWAALAVTDPGMASAPVALATAAGGAAGAAPPRRKPPLAWAAAGLAVLAAAGVGAVLALRGGTPTADTAPDTAPAAPTARATTPRGTDKGVKSPALGSDPTFFNGKDLTGWEGNTGQWRVDGGRLIGRQTGAARVRISSARSYRDFDLSFRITSHGADAKMVATLTLRHNANEKGDDPASRTFNVYFREGAVHSSKNATPVAVEPGKPIEVSVRCLGSEAKVVVNGTTLADGPAKINPEGRISWAPARAGETVIENIRFTDLSQPAAAGAADPTFFTGKDLTGWEYNPKVWGVENGDLVARQGATPGFSGIRGTRRVRDFELTFRARSQAADPGAKSAYCNLTFRRGPDGDKSPAVVLHLAPGSAGKLSVRSEKDWKDWTTLAESPARVRESVKPNDVNTFGVKVVGPRVTVTVNGQIASEGDYPEIPADGTIAWFMEPNCTELRVRDIRFVDLSKPADPDRDAAAALLPHCENMAVRLASGRSLTLKPGDPLPAEPFTLYRIWAPKPAEPKGFAAAVLLPAVAKLPGLEAYSDAYSRVKLTNADLETFAATPSRDRITELGLDLELNPGGVEILKRFPKLERLQVKASGADDALLGRLKELPGVTRLGLGNLNQGGKVTAAGWDALARLPVTALILQSAKGVDRAACEKLAAMPGLEQLTLYAAELDETAVKALAGSKAVTDLTLNNSQIPDAALAPVGGMNGLTALGLLKTPVTDAGLEHLARLTGLTRLNVEGTRATEAGVRKLAAALPGCRIMWDGGVLGPK